MGSWQEILAGPVGDAGFGGIAGLVVGYTTKKAAKLVALFLGSIFLLLQGLSYLGWIEVQWDVVQASLEGAWRDEAGMTAAEHAWAIIVANLPFGAGFGVGFAAGFKLG